MTVAVAQNHFLLRPKIGHSRNNKEKENTKDERRNNLRLRASMRTAFAVELLTNVSIALAARYTQFSFLFIHKIEFVFVYGTPSDTSERSYRLTSTKNKNIEIRYRYRIRLIPSIQSIDSHKTYNNWKSFFSLLFHKHRCTWMARINYFIPWVVLDVRV